MPTDRLFRTHVFVPHTGQFVINELPILVLCCAGWVFGGIDGLPFTTLSMWVALLLSLFLVYRFIYLRRIRYRIGSEQLVCEHGIIWRIVDVTENQWLVHQLCGLKTVSIFSMDRNTPRLDLTGIRRRDDIVTLVRERVEYNKRKKGIYEITNH